MTELSTDWHLTDVSASKPQLRIERKPHMTTEDEKDQYLHSGEGSGRGRAALAIVKVEHSETLQDCFKANHGKRLFSKGQSARARAGRSFHDMDPPFLSTCLPSRA